MSLRTMFAALTATAMGIALLAAPGHAQNDPNATAATAPKATNDTDQPSAAAKRRPATSAAPSTSALAGGAPGGEAANAKAAVRGAGPQSAR
jgi:hypothetical protein